MTQILSADGELTGFGNADLLLPLGISELTGYLARVRVHCAVDHLAAGPIAVPPVVIARIAAGVNIVLLPEGGIAWGDLEHIPLALRCRAGDSVSLVLRSTRKARVRVFAVVHPEDPPPTRFAFELVAR